MASCGPQLTMTGTTSRDARCSKVRMYLDQLDLSICTQYAGPDSILAGQSRLPWALRCILSSLALPILQGTHVMQALLSALIFQAIHHVHEGTRQVTRRLLPQSAGSRHLLKEKLQNILLRVQDQDISQKIPRDESG